MEAEIFYLKDDDGSIPLLKELLRTHIYPNIKLTLHEFEKSGYVRDMSQVGLRYVKLLQASIPPEKGLELNFKKLATFGYRFYLECYYAFNFFSYGHSNWTKELNNIFFPAVAIRNRMLLIPGSLGEQLKCGNIISTPFYPFEMGGVLEVNFGDKNALNEALVKVGKSLNTELRRELKSYAVHQNLRDINLSEIAEDLGVDMMFIQHSLKAEAIEHIVYNQLKCEFNLKKVSLNRWNKVMLAIANKSDMNLSDLTVEISGPIQILPSRIQVNLPAQSTVEVPIAIFPQNPGDFPLEITFVQPEDKLLSDWLPVHYIWVECE